MTVGLKEWGFGLCGCARCTGAYEMGGDDGRCSSSNAVSGGGSPRGRGGFPRWLSPAGRLRVAARPAGID